MKLSEVLKLINNETMVRIEDGLRDEEFPGFYEGMKGKLPYRIVKWVDSNGYSVQSVEPCMEVKGMADFERLDSRNPVKMEAALSLYIAIGKD